MCQAGSAEQINFLQTARFIFSVRLKLEEQYNVVVSNFPILGYLPIVSRKAREVRKEKIRHYQLCIT
jgi:hypothetical protein